MAKPIDCSTQDVAEASVRWKGNDEQKLSRLPLNQQRIIGTCLNGYRRPRPTARNAHDTIASPSIRERKGEPVARAGDAEGSAARQVMSIPTVGLQAIAPTVLLAIPYDRLFDIMEDHFDLTFSVLYALGVEIERTFAAPRARKAVSTGALTGSDTAPPI